MPGFHLRYSNLELTALIADLVVRLGHQRRQAVGAKRVRAAMMAAAGRFPGTPEGVEAAYNAIRAQETFQSVVAPAVRRRFPEVRVLSRDGKVTVTVGVTHVVDEARDIAIKEVRVAGAPLVEAIVALDGTCTAGDLDRLAPLVEAERAAAIEFVGRSIGGARKELETALSRATDPDAVVKGFREYLRQHPIGTQSKNGRSVLAVFGRAMNEVVRKVEGELARKRLVAVVGYADHVQRLRETRLPRRVVFHVGPTNSGKTYGAMKALAEAEDGLYLAPLRLLALEGYESLRDRDLRAGMLTGEEAIDVEGATHLSMTIEMVPMDRPCEVAVIDEVQMLLDPDRGWAWTRALLGVRCRTLYVCGSEDALPLVEKAAGMLGETVEVVRHERKTPLGVEPSPVGVEDVAPGDAVVAFSRREVLFFRELLMARGLTVAAVYGSLSPEVRRTEAARFRSGEAQVLVATDAIGMGLNLGPLRRVVLTALEKFDGTRTRPLKHSEIRQIGGRAGRYGHHEEGFVAVMGGSLRRVREALDGQPDEREDDGLFLVRPEPSTLEDAAREVGTDSLVALLREFGKRTVYAGSQYKAAALQETIEAAARFDRLPLGIPEKFAFASCPTDRRDPQAVQEIVEYAKVRSRGGQVKVGRRPPSFGGPHPLEANEREVKRMSAYLWLARKFPETFPDVEGATHRRRSANALIEVELAAKVGAKARRTRRKGDKAA